MSFPDFQYHAPATVPEALALMQRHGPSLRLMAGGTDLLPRLRSGRVTCAHVLALKGIAELLGASFDSAAGLTLGAGTPLADIARLPAVQTHYPMLGAAIAELATPQVRNKATVVGNCCNASPSADAAPPLMAHHASVQIAGLDGDREVLLEDFIVGPGQTALLPAELARSIRVPVPPEGLRTVFLKHAVRSRIDISTVAVAAALLLDGDVVLRADVFLGTVAPTPMRARQAEQVLIGAPLTPARVEQAARAARDECRPITDFRASREYKQAMVQVLTQRALTGLAGWS